MSGKFQILKHIVKWMPKSWRNAFYQLPYGYQLKEKMGALFSTTEAQWVRFDSGPREGIKMKLKLPEENEFFLETHDPHITRFLCSFLRPGQIFVDIGAHIGYYSLLASKLVGPSGKVFAIEPSPGTVSKLTEHVSENIAANVQILPVAAGSRNEIREFVEFDSSTLNALVSSEDQIPLARKREGVSVVGHLPVPCKTLDSLLEEKMIQLPDFVKIDVEGFEFDVIQGMEKILIQIKPCLLVELHHPQAVKSIPSFLAARGYKAFRIDRGQPEFISGEIKFGDAELRQGVNLLFIKDL